MAISVASLSLPVFADPIACKHTWYSPKLCPPSSTSESRLLMDTTVPACLTLRTTWCGTRKMGCRQKTSPCKIPHRERIVMFSFAATARRMIKRKIGRGDTEVTQCLQGEGFRPHVAPNLATGECLMGSPFNGPACSFASPRMMWRTA